MKANTNNLKYFYDVAELTAFEKVDGRVSAKYVPIYTSAVIEALSPEFTLDYGCKIFKTWSAHYVDLKNDKNETLRIYNSYDRRWAFSMSIIDSDGFRVNVGLDRIVHIGAKAKEFNEEFLSNKQYILDAIENAKVFSTTLKGTKVQPDLAKKITDIIFRKTISTKGFQTLTNDADILLTNTKNGMSVSVYITATLKAFEKGNYTYTVSGVKKIGGKTKSVFNRTQTESLIMDLVEEEFMEYLL